VKMLTRDEARRIAANVAKLSELLGEFRSPPKSMHAFVWLELPWHKVDTLILPMRAETSSRYAPSGSLGGVALPLTPRITFPPRVFVRQRLSQGEFL
jgi:hypothetical protein